MNPTNEELVAQAEARLRKRGSGDSYSPAFLTVAPDGSIGFDFTGHIHAQGLDLDSGANVTPPTDRRIRWLRTVDGSLAAEIYGYNNTNDNGALLAEGVSRNFGASTAIIQARQETDGSFARLLVGTHSQNPPPSPPYQQVAAATDDGLGGGETRTIIDSDRKSSFLQVDQTASPAVGAEQYIKALPAVPIGAIGAHASGFAVGNYTYARSDGPASFFRFAGFMDSTGLAIQWAAQITVNNATTLTVVWRFSNGMLAASPAQNLFPILITDKQVL